MRILYVGEIISKAGMHCIINYLKKVKKEYNITFTIANGDSVTKGYGIGQKHASYLKNLGVDIITTGDQVYYKKDMVEAFSNYYFITRPNNIGSNIGRGWIYNKEHNVAVLNLLSSIPVNRMQAQNPFLPLSNIIEKIREKTKNIIIDFHSATTAEKNLMGLYGAELGVSAVIGSGMKSITSDNQIINNTGYITDTGRTGNFMSISGLNSKEEMQKLLEGIPRKSADDVDNLEIQGVVLELKDSKCISIERIRYSCQEKE